MAVQTSINKHPTQSSKLINYQCTWMQALGCVTLAVGIMMGGPTMAQADTHASPQTITVSAAGQVEAAPDVAQVRVGVETVAETARAALRDNSEQLDKVIGALKAKGFGARDLQTSGFYVQPQYGDNKSRDRAAPIVGYRVGNQLNVTVRDVTSVGAVIDEMVALGANQIQSVTFSVSKADTLIDDARIDAINAARARAELYAKAAGVTLGKVLRITEGGNQHRPEIGRAYARSAAAPIEPGMQTIEASVTVVYEIQ